MKKNLVTTAFLATVMAAAQVGINNEAPMATLDVTAKTTDATKPEGIIAPRLSGDEIKGKDAQYDTPQRGAIVYATGAVTGAPSGKTINITTEGYYYFDGAIWVRFNSGTAGIEPWYDAATNTPATANTQDIYQMGKIGIGTNPTDAYLQINNISDFPEKLQYRFTPNGLGLRATNPQRAGMILSQVNDVTATFEDAPILRFERYRGTQTNLLPLLNGDPIGTIDAQGTVSPNIGQLGARIAFVADGDWSLTNRKASIVFLTNTNNIAATEKMRLSGQGYLGIGTNAPQNPLHIISVGNTGGIRIDDANAWNVKLETNYLTFDRPGPAFVLNTSADAAAMMRLGVGNNIPSSPRKGITILQSGYVGVGQASPQAPLHIEKVNTSDVTPIIIKDLPSYATEAAGTADATLPSGGLYKVTGSSVLYVKP
jgi:hypothetical protein